MGNRARLAPIIDSGHAKLLYSFGNGTDGANPAAPLLEVNGTLYGTTTNGGAYGKGTVFSITTSGTETVLHSLGSVNDGANPYAA